MNSMNRTKKDTALIILCCLGASVFTGLNVWADNLGPGYTSRPDFWFKVLDFVIGLLSLAALPFALSHSSSEEHGEPGPRYALWGALAAIILGGFSNFAIPACIAAMISLFSRRSLMWITLGVLALSAGIIANAWVHPNLSNKDLPAMFLGTATVTIIVLLIGLYRGDERKAFFAHIVDARRQAQDHIARDMHDSLSHRLSLIAVHAGALSYSSAALPKEIRETAETIREQSEAAVEDLRSILQTVHDNDLQDPRHSIMELVEEARAAGDKVELTFREGTSAEVINQLSAVRQHTVHRAIQEGLTNARKHAPGEKVDITVTERGKELQIQMHNRIPSNASTKQTGFGLVGLSERASLAGGKLSVDRDNSKKFSWVLELPLA